MNFTVNPRKTESMRRLGRVDILRLRDAVLAIPESVWDQENSTKPNRFSALDQTRHIPFRFVRDFDDWRYSDDLPLWAQWRALLEPVLTEATAPYQYRRGGYPRIMLARMAPGGGHSSAPRRQPVRQVASQDTRAVADEPPRCV